MGLAHQLLERTRSHALGERLPDLPLASVLREKIHVTGRFMHTCGLVTTQPRPGDTTPGKEGIRQLVRTRDFHRLSRRTPWHAPCYLSEPRCSRPSTTIAPSSGNAISVAV